MRSYATPSIASTSRRSRSSTRWRTEISAESIRGSLPTGTDIAPVATRVRRDVSGHSAPRPTCGVGRT